MSDDEVQEKLNNWQSRWQEQQEKMLKRAKNNSKIVLQKLKKMGIDKVIVHYSGGGDSGDYQSPVFYQGEKKLDDGQIIRSDRYFSRDEADELIRNGQPSVEIEDSVHVHDKNGNWSVQDKTVRVLLTDAIGHIASSLVSHYHGGWENNEGGYGEVVFYVNDNGIEVDHNDYVIETIGSAHSLSFDEPE